MSFQADTSWFSKHHILPLSSLTRIGSFLTGLFVLILVTFASVIGNFARAEGGSGSQFWSHWGDGKAELAGYALRISRYGQPRDGRLVLIYVTEDFSDSARVKADPGRHPPADVYPVLKLNAIRKFQTGIYDYSTMTSAFLRVDGDGTLGALGPLGPLAKLSFSSQEWCGHVYHQLLPQAAGRLVSTSHSYFDGEADDTHTLDWPTGTLAEEEFLLRLRGYAGRADLVEEGGKKSLKLGSSLLHVRLLHQPLRTFDVTIERRSNRETLKTPAGTFSVVTYVVSDGKSERALYHIEAAPPHRVIHYRIEGLEEATLLGSTRLPYWQLQGNGQEALLTKLGLSPVQAPSPVPAPSSAPSPSRAPASVPASSPSPRAGSAGSGPGATQGQPRR